MNKVNFDPKKFYCDSYGNLYPKKSIRPIVFKNLKKSPQPSGKAENVNDK